MIRTTVVAVTCVCQCLCERERERGVVKSRAIEIWVMRDWEECRTLGFLYSLFFFLNGVALQLLPSVRFGSVPSVCTEHAFFFFFFFFLFLNYYFRLQFHMKSEPNTEDISHICGIYSTRNLIQFLFGNYCVINVYVILCSY